MKCVLVGERCCITMAPRIYTRGKRHGRSEKVSRINGNRCPGAMKQFSDTATDAKEKVTELGRDAAGQLSEVAQTATDKVKAAAEYLRQTELTAMAEDVKGIVKRYPGWSIAAAAVVGFLLAHVSSRNTNRFSKHNGLIFGAWPLIRSASATNRLISRRSILLRSGSFAVFSSEAVASSFRCTSAKSSLAIRPHRQTFTKHEYFRPG